MATCYASVWDARDDNKAASTADNLYLFKSLKAVSKRIDQLLTDPRRPRPFFGPWSETRKVLVNSLNTNSLNGTLDLPGALLALTSVTANGTALVVGTNVSLYPDSTMPPYTALQLDACYDGSWWSSCNGCGSAPYASIAGVWGFNSDYANAWVQVDTLRTALADTTTTTLAVNTVDGAGSDGNTPAFSPGNLIMIDSEMMNVTAVSNAVGARTITVQSRGANGSTAATHLISAPVKVWQVEPDVKEVVAKQAGMMNARRGAYTTVEITAMGEVRYPADLLAQLRGVLQGYAYVT